MKFLPSESRRGVILQISLNENRYLCSRINTYSEQSQFKLLSVRDYNFPGQEYVPCVSAMNPLLDLKLVEKREIGIIEHQDFPINEFRFNKIDHKQSMEKICKFVAESKIIITNTYHAAYWSQLMNRKVILYKPFSSKFKNFRHQPIEYSGDLKRDIELSKNYPLFLSESREINKRFFIKVKKIIESI